MNILQSLSLIPICLGAALPFNSNDQSSTQSNLPIYETNIQYQYETNDVNSNDDLINGNLYLMRCENLFGDYITDLIKENSNNFLFELIYAHVDDNFIQDFNIEESLYEGDFYNIIQVYSANTLWISYSGLYGQDYTYYTNGYVDDFTLYDSQDVYFIILYNNSRINDLETRYTFFSRCPTEYIPYILVEPQVSDNIYVNLYDFYYDLFQNEGINSITFEIGSQNISLSSWIAHSLTIISLILLVVITILFVIWLFKFLSGFILLRQS